MPRGGFRVGSGRPKGAKTVNRKAARTAPGPATPQQTAREYLASVVNDPNADPARRDRAAYALLPFTEIKHPPPRAYPEGARARADREAAEAGVGTDWGDDLVWDRSRRSLN